MAAITEHRPLNIQVYPTHVNLLSFQYRG